MFPLPKYVVQELKNDVLWNEKQASEREYIFR